MKNRFLPLIIFTLSLFSTTALPGKLPWKYTFPVTFRACKELLIFLTNRYVQVHPPPQHTLDLDRETLKKGHKKVVLLIKEARNLDIDSPGKVENFISSVSDQVEDLGFKIISDPQWQPSPWKKAIVDYEFFMHQTQEGHLAFRLRPETHDNKLEEYRLRGLIHVLTSIEISIHRRLEDFLVPQENTKKTEPKPQQAKEPNPFKTIMLAIQSESADQPFLTRFDGKLSPNDVRFALKHYRLYPDESRSLSIKTENGSLKYNFSRPFSDSKDGKYLYVSAHVMDSKEKRFCIYYRSRSDTTFRLLPATNKGWHYDKAAGEDTLVVPPEVNAFLHQMVKSTEPDKTPYYLGVGEENFDRFLQVLVRDNNSTTDIVNYHAENIDLFTPKKVELLSFKGREKELWNPSAYVIPANLSPANYKTPIATYPVSNTLHNWPTVVKTYPSKDGTLLYIVHVTKKSDGGTLIRFASPILNSQGPNAFGTTGTAIKAGYMFIPLYEYQSQLAEKFHGPPPTNDPKGNYRSAWNFIRELPETKRWYEDNKIPMPPPYKKKYK